MSLLRIPTTIRVVKVSLDGTVKEVGSGLYGPSGVAVDAAGTLFIADSNHDRVLEAATHRGRFRPGEHLPCRPVLSGAVQPDSHSELPHRYRR